MACLLLLGADPEDRRRLALFAGECGHLAHEAARLEEAVELLRERRPRALLVVDGPGDDAALNLREILRLAPLLPVVVALKKRDATRAVALMRGGAAEVLASPWTREDLDAGLSKSLRASGTSLSVARERAPRPRSAPLYFFAVLLFFGLAFSYVALQRKDELRRRELDKRASWELPYHHPAGMAFDGTDLLVLDWFTQSLYVHDARPAEGEDAPRELPVRKVLPFTKEAPVALAMSRDSVWLVTASGFVSRRMRDGKMTPVGRYPAGSPQPLGIAYDGLYLWTVDGRQKLLLKHLLDDRLSVIASYPYPGAKPVALAFDGKALWSLDAGHRELLRHNLDRPEDITRRLALAEYKDGRYVGVGLAWDGRRFWTVGSVRPEGSAPPRVVVHQTADPAAR